MQSNNMKVMREALEFLIKHKEWLRGYNLTMTLEDLEMVDRILGKAEAALAVPPRNCDVGTVEEQGQRFELFCYQDYCNEKCPLYGKPKIGGDCGCAIDWAQMPYGEGGAK